MPQEPTLNDFSDLVRVSLEDAVERLNREIKAIENQQVSRGLTGNAIRSALDACKALFDSTVLRTFAEVDRVASQTPLIRDDLRQMAVEALTGLLTSIQVVMERFKRHAQGAAGPIAVIDREMQSLDQSLALKARQFDTGLLDLRDQILSTHSVDGRIDLGRASNESTGAIFGGSGGLSANAEIVRPGATVPTSRPRSPGIRDRAEDAERLTRALKRSVEEEVGRLRERRLNNPECAAAIDFLTSVEALLGQIADAIREARQSHSSARMEEKFRQAETLAERLAQAARDYAQNNYERVLNFGGNTLFVVLGTGLFTTLFGISPDLAFAGQLALLNMPIPKK